jgi:hypothetical protein
MLDSVAITRSLMGSKCMWAYANECLYYVSGKETFGLDLKRNEL